LIRNKIAIVLDEKRHTSEKSVRDAGYQEVVGERIIMGTEDVEKNTESLTSHPTPQKNQQKSTTKHY
jgi:hypothetical protein